MLAGEAEFLPLWQPSSSSSSDRSSLVCETSYCSFNLAVIMSEKCQMKSCFCPIQALKEMTSLLMSAIPKPARDIDGGHCAGGIENKQVPDSSLKVKSGGGVTIDERKEILAFVRTKDFFGKGSQNSNERDFLEHEPFECFIGSVVEQITQNLQKVGMNLHRECQKINDTAFSSHYSSQFDHLKILKDLWGGPKTDLNSVLPNFSFERVGSVSLNMVGVTSAVNEEADSFHAQNGEDCSRIPAQKLADQLDIPLSNVELLRSVLTSTSLTKLNQLLPQFGWPSKHFPDKMDLFSAQHFLRYTEKEGRRFFEELDRDGDGQVTLEDLEIAMGKRKLPKKYAQEFIRHARNHRRSKSFGWKQFSTLMEQKEPIILRAYTSLFLSRAGTLQQGKILASLKKEGVPANEENANAMIRFLIEEPERSVGFQASNVVAVAPPVEVPAVKVLISALAGGIASVLSTSIMYPIDSIKTRVQTSTMSFPKILTMLPQIGARELYRGSVPALIGQFSSHGVRTGMFEATKFMLINLAPSISDLQVQSLASFCSTFLGTTVRIPGEVLKQRLQAGMFNNVGEAIAGTWNQDGLKGFFRGTGATLCREIPFYVTGTALYNASKKAVRKKLRRELMAWETIAIGALTGGLTAMLTTPLDVVKTRMMTAPQGQYLSMSSVAILVLTQEGLLGFFKGAVPRFFWIAPLGAMNFAGYELIRTAMEKKRG